MKKIFHLVGDEVDLIGRVIGREGRNAQAFSQATGVSLSFSDCTIELETGDPIALELAVNVMKILLKDGRIHPAKIQELVQQNTPHAHAKSEMSAGDLRKGEKGERDESSAAI